MTELKLTQEWDKVFPKSEKVNHRKITFHNRYGITLAADLYEPKDVQGKLPAIAVSGPFGAVKEQSSGLYAQTMAERGFLTIAFDPSYTGESGGEPRYVASPDINTEDFSAAVDFLSVQENVDPERIGIIGICGWGGMALNAAANDPRIKATVASTMYDMSRVNAQGYFDSMDADARYELRKDLNAQRIVDYKNGTYERAGGVVDPPKRMAKRRSCRRTAEENQWHEKAVKIRKMTDEQIIRFVEGEAQQKYDEGYREGLLAGRQGKKKERTVGEFLDKALGMKGIGEVTINKMKRMAEENGYI